MAVFQHVRAAGERGVGLLPGGVFPFRLARQAHAGPARIRVSLEVAYVGDGRLQFQVLHDTQREHAPLVALALPVQRGAPAFRADTVPAGRQPQLGALVAAVADEGQEFVLRDEAVCQMEGGKQHLVSGALVVEAETAAIVADTADAAAVARPARRGTGGKGGRSGGHIRRF
ncbi:hypothetical protein G6F22_017856 [Rhizopus arrhizus]|nr:hypothetical protein G6F22_017856 [Rhizopus arrhizus]